MAEASSWQPAYPANPSDGDYRTTNDASSGRTIIERWNALTNQWEWHMMILPETTVTANPNQYPYLQNVLRDFPITVPALGVFTFDLSTLSWKVIPIVENNVRTPCLHDRIEAIRNDDLSTDVQDILDEAFDNDDSPNSFAFTESTTLDKPARTEVVNDVPLQVMTTLHKTVLQNASNEYITIIIYHEIIHGILFYQNKTEDLHHTEILNKYLEELIGVGNHYFPNMADKDIAAIALSGLTSISGTNAYADALTNYGLTQAEVGSISLSYRRDDVPGNVKKGTPCS